MNAQTHNATALLHRFGKGDTAIDERLVGLVYDELRALAHRQLMAEASPGLLQTTALANEAYLKLVDQTKTNWKNRAHFFAIAARLIRRILVDEARARQAAKRGGGWKRISLDTGFAEDSISSIDLVALEDALEKLAKLDARQAHVVELRFFGGLSIEEVTEVLEVSPRTVKADWHLARAWLHRELS